MALGSRLGLTPEEYRLYRNKKRRDRWLNDPEFKERHYKFNRKCILKTRFKLEWEDYLRILEQQDHCCKICGEKETERELAVDHCHKTGKVRGLLCGKCNRALGLLNDSPELLDKAKEYVLSSIVC